MNEPQLYSGRELRKRMLRLDPEVRRRVDRAVRRGARVESVEEARLAVSMARSSLKTVPLLIGLLVFLAGLRVVSVVHRGLEVFDVILFIVLVAALGKFAFWDLPRFRRAERLNRPLLDRPR